MQHASEQQIKPLLEIIRLGIIILRMEIGCYIGQNRFAYFQEVNKHKGNNKELHITNLFNIFFRKNSAPSLSPLHGQSYNG